MGKPNSKGSKPNNQKFNNPNKKPISKINKPNNKMNKSNNKKQNFNNKGKKISKLNKNKNRQNDNQQLTNQNNENNQLQNSYGLIDKQKLLSMNSDKQIQTIKSIHKKLIQNPQANIRHLQTLFLLTKVSNLKVVAYVLRSMSDIFINIAPLEFVNLKSLQQRTQNQITKDQFTVIKYQKVLVQQYERYLNILKQLRVKLKPVHFNNDQQLYTQFKKCLLQCGITLFKTLWNFNYNKQLCQLLLYFIKFKQCQTVFQSMLADQNIATVSIKVKIINAIAQLIRKKQDNQLPNDIIKIINSTYIDTRYLQKDKQALTFKKKKIKQKMYRQQAFEKKAQKQKGKQEEDKLTQKRKKKQQKLQIKMRIKQQIEKQFAEGQAVISNKQVVRNNSLILQQLFYIYFKFLVQRISSKFVKDILDGILKFSHFINIDLISSMIQHLDRAAKIFRQLWKKYPNNQNLQKRFLIVFTMESIINGPLSVYNMDDLSVNTNFYRIFRDINNKNNQSKVKITKQLFRIICITLEECFIKRRQLSQQIVGSFLRQISIFITRSDVPKLYLLQIIRLCASKYGKVSRMFEQDNQGYGINAYNEACEDPQSTNAINTQILSKINSLKKLNYRYSKHYQNQTFQYITRLNRQNFQRIQGTQTLQNMLKDDLVVGFE